MRSASIFAAAACIAACLAVPVQETRHVLHEKRHSIPRGWEKRTALPGHVKLPMKIALAQSNLDRVEDLLMEVSHPQSERYGQHWSQEQIATMFAPSQETYDTVREWLRGAGIADSRVSLSRSGGWLHFDATVDEAQRLLKTDYFLYEHGASGTPQPACDEYHVPEHVSRHVDFITPTLHFDAKVRGRTTNQKKKRDLPAELTKKDNGAAAHHQVVNGTARDIVNPANLPKDGGRLGEASNLISELKNCDQIITPDCLRALYSIPPVITGGKAQGNLAYGIVEYTPESYLQSDLDMFFANFSRYQQQKTPINASIDGGFQQTDMTGFGYQGEPDLDLQYGMTLVNPIPVTVFQVGDEIESGSFNNFLDAIDGSYCTYDGGDDPTQDAVYPDPAPGGYKGPEDCGKYKPTHVISTSYGYNEADLTPFYERRQCHEYAKLGMAGVSVLYSSGDSGVAGGGGECIDPATGEYNDGTSGLFNPGFPPSCPYVTAVGATQVKPNASVLMPNPEEACETVIYSGGGFSNVFAMPAYQKAAIAEYYKNHAPPYGADRYNNSQRVRGHPDVAANGANFVVAVDGDFSLVYGTSASSPTFGSVVTIINEARAVAGKGPVGFLNPTLYANPFAFTDITSGDNPGCGTNGFSAVPGWDPVTGLGTPNTARLLALFLTLP